MAAPTDTAPPAAVDPATPGRKRRRAGLAGALVLATAAIATIPLTTGHHHATAAYDSACGLTGGSTALPTKAPTVQWQNLDGSWLPVSTTQGPGRRNATGPWTCYAHTPTGALLAAWSIPAHMDPANFAAIVQRQTVPGAGQTALLKQGPSAIPTDQLPTPIGYRIEAYDGSTATVTLFMRQRGSNVSCASGVQWSGGNNGDWLERLSSDGNVWSGCEQLPTDLHGLNFIAWGPNA